jgi:hypothetical protein
VDIKQTEKDRLRSFTTYPRVKTTRGVSLMLNNSIDDFFSPHACGARPGKAVPFAVQVCAKLTPRLIQYYS